MLNVEPVIVLSAGLVPKTELPVLVVRTRCSLESTTHLLQKKININQQLKSMSYVNMSRIGNGSVKLLVKQNNSNVIKCNKKKYTRRFLPDVVLYRRIITVASFAFARSTLI